ncbi:cysteine--tRNA ligase [Ureaplasma ceti]|uniref:Cysteine--tRNA ligase n=1 Tax=Ureaplasma ceti TaxID=3119530 RepID=A0ABP9UBX5_9BACT
MVKLYDSKTNNLIELNEEEISIYNCGPTVYNHIHIGNARPLITFDVLNRLLLKLGKKVTYVLNITDIDDKIINEALKQNMAELDLSNHYTEEYLKIKAALNTLPMTNPKVSENIAGIIEYIAQLVDNGSAYVVDGDVYFDTTKNPNYGSISKRKPDELLEGARVEKDLKKRHPNDFVLWKKTDKGIQWDTEWCRGRPGWHTECAYLIHKLIGNQATIHGGGMDLKFPHHENENAQNEALYGCSLAKVWMHVGMININNEKMSKSLNNFILVKDILQEYTYQALRWFFYQANFSNPLNYSKEVMDSMESEVNKFKTSLNQARNFMLINGIDYSINPETINPEIINFLSDNLNVNNAITVIYDINKRLNIAIRNKQAEEVKNLYFELLNGLDLLGINFPNLHTAEVNELVLAWNTEMKAKNYSKSDEIRQELIKKGVM